MWHYSEGMDPSDELFLTQFSGLTGFDIAAPTAQEIADQLPKRVNEYRLFLEYGDDETLWTGYRSAETKSDYMLTPTAWPKR